jgi:hypothetical protein
MPIRRKALGVIVVVVVVDVVVEDVGGTWEDGMEVAVDVVEVVVEEDGAVEMVAEVVDGVDQVHLMQRRVEVSLHSLEIKLHLIKTGHGGDIVLRENRLLMSADQ